MARYLLVLLMVVGLCTPVQSAESVTATRTIELEPFKLIRSLQLLQDKLAVQGVALLNENRSALDAIGKALPRVQKADWAVPKNLNALAQYLLLGGNPTIVENLIASGALTAESSELLSGTLSYVTKRGKARGERFARLDFTDFNPLLKANVAYVQGLLLVQESPKSAAQKFSKARLWAPGTLIEEAALRAELEISITTAEKARFEVLSRQYFQRFPNAALLPRMARRASAFLIGNAHISDGDRLALVQSWFSRLDRRRADILRLELANQAVLAGDFLLASGMAQKALECGGCPRQYLARATLYRLASSLITAEGLKVVSALEAVDPKLLTKGDLELRESAIAIAKIIWRPIVPVAKDFELRTMSVVPPVDPKDAQWEKARDDVSEAHREMAYVDSLLEGKSR